MKISAWSALVIVVLVWSGHELLKIVASRSTTVDAGFAAVVALAILVLISTHFLVEGSHSRRRKPAPAATPAATPSGRFAPGTWLRRSGWVPLLVGFLVGISLVGLTR
jgi:hypothetical protein